MSWFFCFSYFITTFATVILIIFLKVMLRVTTFPGINFKVMIVLFIMTSIFSIYHTQIFYLVQIVFMLLVSIFVNIPFLYSVFNYIFYVNNITNIFDNNLYITGLLNRDN